MKKRGTRQVFYDDKEARSAARRRRDQDTKLARMIRRAYERSTRFRKTIDDLGCDPSEFRTVGNLEKLPVISRAKLIEMEMENPPYGGLENPKAAVGRVFTSPGPVYEPHLPEEDPLWARAYWAAGFRPGDTVLNAFSYHLVAAGLTFHGGLRRVGATVVPSGTASADIQVQLLRDLRITGYTGTPSFLAAIMKRAEELGHDVRKEFRLRRAGFAAEPLDVSLRSRFEREYGIDTYQMYGATEVGDVAYECREKKGWHLCEEVVVEIVDPETGKAVPPGTLGEVVVTRPNDIFYLFRFATGDLSSLDESSCPCGRTAYRLTGIAGRVGDAVKVRGMFVAPSQLKKVGDQLPGIKFQLEVDRKADRDILRVRLERAGDEAALRSLFEKTFRNLCTVGIDECVWVEPGTLDGDLIKDRRPWK
ncbi:MAG TPA: AMP-binding protein [Syntrophales bacterium]|nr:AMP-binding protein [Syntrophales bacterium]HOX93763.1 AMP-binding protein [Syntrophales bacterium]HPI55904.1 AMP-binding protein [Syntrophales bacterium]HPN23605.1 AMP-binding protein [Syntrophales bacterium]HQM27870.1 AMP-binding protein [Syntrophales bacterium]